MTMTVDMLRDVLGWCAIINMALLLVSFLFFRFARTWIYGLHGKWFHLSEEKFDAIWYAMLGCFKMAVLIFNVVPYFALLIVG